MPYTIEFPGSPHSAISIESGAIISQELTVLNSPVLFGCRTGICGTCLVQIKSGQNSLAPPTPEELEALEVYAPGVEHARLACQISLNSDIAIVPIEAI